MNVHVALSLIHVVLIDLVNLHKDELLKERSSYFSRRIIWNIDKLKTQTLYSKRFLERRSNEQNRFFQCYPWTNVKGWSKEAFHWEKKENLVLIWSWHRYSKAWISKLLTLYLHFIWSGPFSRLIFFIYLLLHDCINLHYEEEKLILK